jgi:hypothetical protein
MAIAPVLNESHAICENPTPTTKIGLENLKKAAQRKYSGIERMQCI